MNKTIVVVGASRGIGKALVEKLLTNCNVINISRTIPEISHSNFTHHNCDVTQDELPEIETADGYYNNWCFSMRWTPMLATRIRSACQARGLDASRYGAQVGSRQIREKSNVDWKRLSPNDAD